MRRLLSIIVSLVTAISFAQQPVELPLWPDGAPNSSGLTGEEQETRPHFVTNVTHPTLTVYHPEKPNGMAIIMCPGGGIVDWVWMERGMIWPPGSADKVLPIWY